MKMFTDAELAELLRECALDAIHLRKSMPHVPLQKVVERAASDVLARLNKLQTLGE